MTVGKKLSDEELVRTIECYINNNVSMIDAGKVLGLSKATVWERLHNARGRGLITPEHEERIRLMKEGIKGQKKTGVSWNPAEIKDDIALLRVEHSQQEEEIIRLNTQLRELQAKEKIAVHNFFDKRARFGVLTDVHIGSLYSREDVLNAAYDTFEKEEIEHVYIPGDILAGEKMYRGQRLEIYAHGADAQIEEFVNRMPRKSGITTHFILGNHDLSFWKRSGVDVGDRIATERKDMDYLGKEEADVVIGKGKRTVRLRLSHPGKGTAYALSYQPQKYIEALSGGQKPHIILMGHYHKAEMLPSYRNVFLIQCGCIESQTPYMRRMNIAAHVGFWIIDFTINQPNNLSRFKAEFFAMFEKEAV
jgi:UDP-2,3-diacylglucosamine pyrophosphatase LpxH